MNKNIYKTITIFALLIFIVFDSKGQGDINGTNVTTDNGGSAIGYETTATGTNSFAAIKLSEATGQNSLALGYRAKASGIKSNAIGLYAQSTATNTVTLGNYISATATEAFVIGSGAGHYEYQWLVNAHPGTIMMGTGGTKSTLFIDRSPSPSTTGNVGIGDVVDPLAKLHIKADEDQDVALLLESGGEDYYANLNFGSTNNQIRSKGMDNLEFNTAETFYFRDNNVGIHQNNALAPLHIDRDWTFNVSTKTGRNIAYNAYLKGEYFYRIDKGRSASIRYTDKEDIIFETDIEGGIGEIPTNNGTLITYETALWINDGEVGVRKDPSYPLDVDGTTRTDNIISETDINLICLSVCFPKF